MRVVWFVWHCVIQYGDRYFKLLLWINSYGNTDVNRRLGVQCATLDYGEMFIIIMHLLRAIHPGKNLIGGTDKTFSTYKVNIK